MALKVFIEPGGEHSSVKSMFIEEGYEVVRFVKDADFVCFIGGSDINPSLYNEENNGSYVYSDFVDLVSLGLWSLCERYEKPMVGICRGGQFLNVMCGGKLIQHIDYHDSPHTIEIPAPNLYQGFDGIKVTSDHHQAIIPNAHDFSFLSNDGTVEVVVYRHSFHDPNKPIQQTICYQPHPEWVVEHDPCRRLFFALIENEFQLGKEN